MHRYTLATPLAVLVTLLLAVCAAFGHCDGMDGPVVKAAQQALETGNLNHVLIWVKKKDEGELRHAFEKTVAVRKLSPEARELADRFFFETAVRLHRSGEGAPYDGLKPAGRDLGPAIPAADKALESGNLQPVGKLLAEEMQSGLHKRFEQVIAEKQYRVDDVAAGQRYVDAYVAFVHYVERLHEAAQQSSAGHYHEAGHGESGPKHAVPHQEAKK